MNAVRERRRRHNLTGDVCRLETWVEFQNYHLHMQEQLEGRVQVEAENLRAAEAEGVAASVEAYTVRSASATRKARSHEELLLPWVEQRRIEMVAVQPATVDDAGGHDQIGIIRSTRKGSRKHAWFSALLGRQSRNLRSRRVDAVRFPRHRRQRNRLPTPRAIPRKPPTSAPQCARVYAPLRPFSPQKVIKTTRREPKPKQRGGVNTSLRPLTETRKTRSGNATQKEKSSRLKSTLKRPPGCFKTRSGRVSKRPERPVFVSMV